MQTDIRVGLRPINCGEDLTGKEDRLVKLADGGTKAEVLLPTAISDFVPFLLLSGEAEDTQGKVQPFTGEQQHRVLMKGTGNAGDTLCLADPSTAADKGKLRKLPASAGTYRGLAIAEEDFVDGQTALVRPYPLGNIVVS